MPGVRFPRLYAAASLKREDGQGPAVADAGFPRLYAAASLKHLGRHHPADLGNGFSAALCRGLIEATGRPGWPGSVDRRFPRLYAAASLKHSIQSRLHGERVIVFRGFMPRPH